MTSNHRRFSDPPQGPPGLPGLPAPQLSNGAAPTASSFQGVNDIASSCPPPPPPPSQPNAEHHHHPMQSMDTTSPHRAIPCQSGQSYQHRHSSDPPSNAHPWHQPYQAVQPAPHHDQRMHRQHYNQYPRAWPQLANYAGNPPPPPPPQSSVDDGSAYLSISICVADLKNKLSLVTRERDDLAKEAETTAAKLSAMQAEKEELTLKLEGVNNQLTSAMAEKTELAAKLESTEADSNLTRDEGASISSLATRHGDATKSKSSINLSSFEGGNEVETTCLETEKEDTVLEANRLENAQSKETMRVEEASIASLATRHGDATKSESSIHPSSFEGGNEAETTCLERDEEDTVVESSRLENVLSTTADSRLSKDEEIFIASLATRHGDATNSKSSATPKKCRMKLALNFHKALIFASRGIYIDVKALTFANRGIYVDIESSLIRCSCNHKPCAKRDLHGYTKHFQSKFHRKYEEERLDDGEIARLREAKATYLRMNPMIEEQSIRKMRKMREINKSSCEEGNEAETTCLEIDKEDTVVESNILENVQSTTADSRLARDEIASIVSLAKRHGDATNSKSSINPSPSEGGNEAENTSLETEKEDTVVESNRLENAQSQETTRDEGASIVFVSLATRRDDATNSKSKSKLSINPSSFEGGNEAETTCLDTEKKDTVVESNSTENAQSTTADLHIMRDEEAPIASLATRHNEATTLKSSINSSSFEGGNETETTCLDTEKEDTVVESNRIENAQPTTVDSRLTKDVEASIASLATRHNDATNSKSSINPPSFEEGNEVETTCLETEKEDTVVESNILENALSTTAASERKASEISNTDGKTSDAHDANDMFGESGGDSDQEYKDIGDAEETVDSRLTRDEEASIASLATRHGDATNSKLSIHTSPFEGGNKAETTSLEIEEKVTVLESNRLENAQYEETMSAINSDKPSSTLLAAGKTSEAGTEASNDEGCDSRWAGDASQNEVALFDMLDKQLKAQKQQEGTMRAQRKRGRQTMKEPLGSPQDFHAAKPTNTAAVATTAVKKRKQCKSPSRTNARKEPLSSPQDFHATKPTDTVAVATAAKKQKQSKSPISNATSFSQTNAREKPRAATAVAAKISGAASACSGNRKEVISLMSSSSSSSVPSNSSDSDEGKSCNKKPRSLPHKNPSQSLQNNAPTAGQLTVGNHTSVPNKPITRISIPSKPAPLLRASRKRPATTQILSIASSNSNNTNVISVPSKPGPLLRASRKRTAPTQIVSMASSNSNNTNVPPTELSRLWPDPSDVIKAITRWQPPKAAVHKKTRGKQFVEFYGQIQFRYNGSEEERNNPMLQPPRGGRSRDVPKEFKNASDIMDAMAYPLMNEGLCSIDGDYRADKFGNGKWRRDLCHLKMTNLIEVSPLLQSKSYFSDKVKMYEAQFSKCAGTNFPPASASDLYCMNFQGWQDCKFGVVVHEFPTTASSHKYKEGKSSLKLWIVVHPNERDTKDTGWLSQSDFKKLLDPQKKDLIVKPNIIFTLMCCGSTTNIIRQFEAIKSLPHLKPHLQNALFASCITDSSKPASTSKPRSVPVDIWKSLTKSHNSYQLSSISQVLTGSCRENVCLIQGPPGTGKSSTIAGLVSALLSGKAPLPKQRQSGCLIHGANTVPQARNRILVCAATNQAVDSLAWKINQGSIGPSGNVGDFVMARFGSLPWERSRNSGNQKPILLSEMEEFLHEINVDHQMNELKQALENANDPEEEVEKTNPQSRKTGKPVGKGKLRSSIMGNSNVVIATLSGAGSKAFIQAVGRDTKNGSEFDAVIIDEACQASEPESLIPFKFNPTTITLVGDPKQLPVLSLAGPSSPYTKLFERSLFERLQSLDFPTILLRNQYRMHRDIAAFPSEQFYQGKLITPDSIKNRSKPSWSSCPCFPPICFWDINGRNMAANAKGHGFSNKEEADFITHTILSTLAHTFLEKSDVNVTVGIISFYREQVNLLQQQLQRIPVLKNSRLNVKVATVDGFQGSECDIIILSCVRSHSRANNSHTNKRGQKRGGRVSSPGSGSIGFLNDNRRVNVALTRARCSLWIVGNAEVLMASELWRNLINYLNQQRDVCSGGAFKDTFGTWKASEE